MIGFHEKRKLKQWLRSRAFLVFMLVPIGFLTFAAHNAYITQQDTMERRIEVAAELALLQERASRLEADIVELEDPRGVEAALRQRYEVGKEGEEVIVLVEDETVVQEEPIVIEEIDESFWTKALQLLGIR